MLDGPAVAIILYILGSWAFTLAIFSYGALVRQLPPEKQKSKLKVIPFFWRSDNWELLIGHYHQEFHNSALNVFLWSARILLGAAIPAGFAVWVLTPNT